MSGFNAGKVKTSNWFDKDIVVKNSGNIDKEESRKYNNPFSNSEINKTEDLKKDNKGITDVNGDKTLVKNTENKDENIAANSDKKIEIVKKKAGRKTVVEPKGDSRIQKEIRAAWNRQGRAAHRKIVTVTLPEELLEKIDEAMIACGMESRNEFMLDALDAIIHRFQKEKII